MVLLKIKIEKLINRWIDSKIKNKLNITDNYFMK